MAKVKRKVRGYTPRSSRLVRRIHRVDPDGWVYDRDDKSIVQFVKSHHEKCRLNETTQYGSYMKSACAFCGFDVVDRADVKKSEPPCACEVCRKRIHES